PHDAKRWPRALHHHTRHSPLAIDGNPPGFAGIDLDGLRYAIRAAAKTERTIAIFHGVQDRLGVVRLAIADGAEIFDKTHGVRSVSVASGARRLVVRAIGDYPGILSNSRDT